MSVPRLRHPLRAMIFSVIAVLLSAASPSVNLGRVEGFVRDQAGAGIANAEVLIVGTSHSALTDARGHYLIGGLTAGPVDMLAAFVGYRPLTIRGVPVTAGQTTRRNFVLETSVVEVTALEMRDQRARSEPPAADAAKTNGFSEAAITTGAAAAEFGNSGSGVISRNNPPRFVGPTSPPPCCYRQVTPPPQDFNTEEYSHIRENGFRPVSSAPLSTFSIDVDKASYANVRRFLNQGSLPPVDAVRIEEMINYFSYELPEPRGEHPFSITTEVGAAPWAASHRLVRVGIQGKRLRGERIPPSNLVFLIDVSGSMQPENKLPLVKRSLRLLVDQLRDEDKVSIVVYAGAAGLVLPCTPGTERTRILNAIDRLDAGGSTAGGAGIQLAYRIARENFVSEGNNRVILATD
ncbi:MAG: von Willebrand factor type A domain-containing protein, partial [Gemmatimonadota bacterium]